MAIVCNVIADAPKAAMDYLIYPDQHPANKQYIMNQLDNYSHMLLDAGKQYFSQAREMFEKINDSEAIRSARAALRMAKGIVRPNVVIELTGIEDVRSAQPIMQRYIMAEPTIRQLYFDQRCDGYSDSYVEIFPNILGKDHIDYRKVMTGMVEEFVDEDGEDCWRVNQYTNELSEGEEDLSFDNKVDILHTWEIVRMAIERNIDPTDRFGGNL